MSSLSAWSNRYFESIGNQVLFLARCGSHTFRKGFEWEELVRQCYHVGYKSLPLVGITGFILGFVLTLQSYPTMKDFGAESYVPSMVSLSMFREIGPVIIALICAGRIASGIGAELGSMQVTEQIDAMNVSGANPIQYLVVTRILACTIMVPLLVLMADALSLLGGLTGSNLQSDISPVLYFAKAFKSLEFSDLLPAFIKSVFFGFAIGFVGCYKGFYVAKGTESVGFAANAAVVNASLWIIVMDAIAVQLTALLAYN